MIRRRSGIILGAALLLVVGLLAVDDSPAYADHHAPPSTFPGNCPIGQAPPPGYPNPPPTTPWLYTGPTYADWGIVSGHSYSGSIPYEVPFKGVIGKTIIDHGKRIDVGGSIVVPAHGNAPKLEIPNLFATLCGRIQLPQLSGTIAPADIDLPNPNIYIAGLEALPISVNFGTLHSTIDLTPAHNGGLDITLAGSTQSSVSTLGMTCSITLNATFTTKGTGSLSSVSQPVTGPTMSGQAEAASNSFGVPTVLGSNSTSGPNHLCPPSIAQTFNKLLGLPLASGMATFIAPFCFDFELEGPNQPSANNTCPWP